ncbi:geranylgeranyl reductase family protein [Sulfurovum sp. NBC37-1]|uniref:geranylgeranyl reductase family protein n=1 Tax=Sulfurovum sp. (strain NBC37-1) TaxID=387093 RepID=UPI00015879E5|nr:geranylgeranyl reductase family protein [Sulfurovum sp. NBC37-1]BAF72397.1 geranylgeranyl hydrogenase [Sulfurovum sp. NBC37-1]
MIRTDILIIGGGPAGSTLARYLAEAGKETILVQRNFNFRKPCGGGIRLDAFDEFDIDRELIRKEVNSIALVFGTKRVEVDISQMPLGIVDRVEFDTYLRNRAEDTGATLLEASFVDVEVCDGYIIVTIEQDGVYKKIHAGYLVGADGVNSKVRKCINGDRVPSAMTRYADLAHTAYKTCEFHFGSKVAGSYYAWAFPHTNGSNIGTLAGDDETHIQHFMKQLDVKEKVKLLGYRIPQFENPVFYKDRVFFVGDSASQVLPFTYEGIYYAMASAHLLSAVLTEQADPSEYEKRWNDTYLQKFTTLQRLQKLFLKNDLTIAMMMHLYRNKAVQQRMVDFWLGHREVKLNRTFFYKVMKKLLTI